MLKTTFPLHPAQRDIYVDQLLNTGSSHYNIGGYIKLQGNLNREKFREAVNSAAKLFDAFKMRFDLEAADQVCYAESSYDILELTELDFSDRENPKKDALLWMQQRFNRHFLIKKDNPLSEHSLIKISVDEHWFFGRYHHLITDGFGFIVFIQYVGLKYKSLLSDDGQEFKYPSYLDELEKANEYFDSPAYEKDSDYWKEKIIERPPGIIQRKYLHPEDSKLACSKYSILFNEEQREALDKIQLSTGSGLQQLTIAALLIFFGKTTGRSDFIFGIPVHKRSSRMLRNIVGMFSGVLPFKGNYNEDILISDLLHYISQTQKSDYRHQNFPLGDIARNISSRTPEDQLFEISINYEPLNFEPDFGSNIKADVIRLESDFDKNPLQFFWRDYGSKQPLQLIVKFGNQYFEKKEIELLTNRLLFIINQFPGSLNKKAGSIKLLPDNELSLLKKFNETSQDFHIDKDIASEFEDQSLKTPDNISLVFEEQNITYKELNERSNQLAHYLISKGIKPEQLIPIYIERSIEMITCILGILKVGCAYVPIDPEYPEDRIGFMLKDTGASIVISSKKCSHKLKSCSGIEIISFDEDGSEIIRQPKINIQRSSLLNQLAYVIYTSGSTGKPKGVMTEHRTIINLIKSQSKYFKVNSGDRILQFSNYGFDASVEQIFLALLNGASLILFPDGLQKDINRFEKFLIDEKINHLHATPSFLENINPEIKCDLKRVIAGGDVCKRELAEKWKDTVSFFNEYGPTETTVTAIEYHAEGDLEKFITLPIGRPLSNIQVFILNENNELCPVGVTGEICIAGDCLARGYLNNAGLTDEKFVKNPFSQIPDEKMYKTGDTGRWLPEGLIEYLGRIDEQVKIRGYRIELGEIENALQECELVSKSAVTTKQDGSGNKCLAAYIVPEGKFNRDIIETYLKKKLPEYMIPVLWKEMVSLPLTSNGKVDKKTLPDLNFSEMISSEYEAPRNELEKVLSEMWKEILKTEKVGINDNFFELGGHSLSAIQLSSRLQKQLNINADIGTILSNPTISKLAKVLNSEKQNGQSKINKLPEAKYYELSHSQKRFWILSNFKHGSEAYNVSSVFDIEGDLNTDAFKKAFNKVIERHEILRTVFTDIDGEPKQIILPPDTAGFEIEENDFRDRRDAEMIIKKLTDEDSNKPFDLKAGPLLRAALFRVKDYRYVFVLNIHHIISDGWSKGIFIKEFLNLYKSYTENKESNLAELPVQYKDYAAWHKDSFEKQGQYWRQLYKNDIPVLNFPSDFERPKVLTYFGGLIHQTIPETLVKSLRETAVRSNMSLNNLLLTLYGLIVARESGQEEVVIGTVSSGRSHPDLENLIGVFINFLPLKLSPKKYLRLPEYLNESLTSIMNAYKNQDYPFDLLVDDCIKKRDISRNPFFDTMINFQLENEFQNNESEIEKTGIRIKQNDSMLEELFRSVLDFKLDIIPSGKILNLYISYNTKLFTNQRMNGFLNEFINLLKLTVEKPDGYLTQYGDWKDIPNTEIQSESKTELKSKTEIKMNSMPVNVCASFIIEPVKQYMEYWSNEFELNVNVEFTPYNQVFQQLLNPGSILHGSKGLNILFIRIEDWLRDHKDKSTAEQIVFLDKTFDEFKIVMQDFRKRSFIPLLTGIVPVYSTIIETEVKNKIENLNNELGLFLSELPSTQLLDLSKVAALYDVEEIYDAKSDELGHIPFMQEYYAAIGTYLIRKVSALINPGYKVIALDCDNTLWKGVCGEAGALNVMIDENYIQLQEFFIEKYNEGFLIALCSKNNEEDVWEVFSKHPEMKLKREHIAAHRINWKPKHDNLKEIAKELNLGLNSIVFLDDSEFETEQVSMNCPDVLALTLPEDPDEFRSFLDHIWAFDYFRITDEDRKRNEMYRVEKQRKEEENKFGTLEDYLKSLEIKVDVRTLEMKDLERAVQLTLRTNQFNLNGIRKTPEEIAKLIGDEKSINWIIEVKDRFGDYGIVGLVLGKVTDNVLVIETFLLSCRVLGRNVEGIILSELQNYCTANGLDTITALFEPTPKNKPFQEFLEKSEWQSDPETNKKFIFLKSTNHVMA